MLQFSWEEIRQKQLLVINGECFDVKSFLAEHPGGAEALSKNFARDASSNFARIVDHEDSAAQEQLAKLKVGKVAAASSSVKKTNTPQVVQGRSSSRYGLWVLALIAVVLYAVYLK
jgi:cytochrome b involved in lipid metabolism